MLIHPFHSPKAQAETLGGRGKGFPHDPHCLPPAITNRSDPPAWRGTLVILRDLCLANARALPGEDKPSAGRLRGDVCDLGEVGAFGPCVFESRDGAA